MPASPIRVRPGSRVLMHLLNASAVENRTIALPGHEFHVLALDGNPVPNPRSVKVLTLGPGERIDAIVEMNQPGVWILGAIDDATRQGGLGVVVEFAEPAPASRSGWRRNPGSTGTTRCSAVVRCRQTARTDHRDGLRKSARWRPATSTCIR